ncbi:MAG: hypothetical protein F4Y71_13905 [Acidobacteria bacterium]|nr:hypothetical protein [Acidobacteriota bacterium]MYG74895.1 hypothetical protein [Acidobacteriota bacterium]
MNRTLPLGAAALAAAVLGWGCGGGEPPAEEDTAAEPATPEPAPQVEAADIDAALANGAVLLDVRTDEELAEHGTIDGFVHIPIDELEARIGELPAGVPVLTA